MILACGYGGVGISGIDQLGCKSRKEKKNNPCPNRPDGIVKLSGKWEAGVHLIGFCNFAQTRFGFPTIGGEVALHGGFGFGLDGPVLDFSIGLAFVLSDGVKGALSEGVSIVRADGKFWRSTGPIRVKQDGHGALAEVKFVAVGKGWAKHELSGAGDFTGDPPGAGKNQ